MSDRSTQLKIMLVSLFFSTVVASVCLYARPQQSAYPVVKAEKTIRTVDLR